MENIREFVGEYTHILPEAVTYYKISTKVEVDQEAVLLFRIPNENNKDHVIGYIKAEHPLDKPEIFVSKLVE